MSLLELKGIGKIYVSDGNVAVGIRGVDLSFERGEFVAVTGKSGSGKSTLLNVISGMDSYEEGELYINGEPTSHYLQSDWEEYRERYVSFIFQDYNIIDSFTVLQNVELSLMHIADPRARRARAMELIARVGLSTHAKHKGSKLSGGQKQRTVIARALAKDSPVILADEPTGNLDFDTSKEIIALLREVSEDKLVIVVTHNFDQLEDCATRHVRIFDGEIESDRQIRPVPPADIGKDEPEDVNAVGTNEKSSKKQKIKKQIRDGAILGRTIFFAKPKLSVFLCVLMALGALGMFMSTAVCGEAFEVFEKDLMFNHIDGRVVIARRDGAPLSESEVEALAHDHGAQSYLRFDELLDDYGSATVIFPTEDQSFLQRYGYPAASYVCGKDYGDGIVGRYPEGVSEVFLYLPITYRPVLGEKSLNTDKVLVGGMEYDLVGVKYYYDNNVVPECLFSEDGFSTATAIHYLVGRSNPSVKVRVTGADGESSKSFELYSVIPSFDMPEDKIYVGSSDYAGFTAKLEREGKPYSVSADFNSTYYTYDYDYGAEGTAVLFEHSFTGADIASERPVMSELFTQENNTQNCVYISDELIRDIAQTVLDLSYRQASLFFEDDSAASLAASRIEKEGYLAVPSYTEYEPGAMDTVIELIACIFLGFLWIMSIVFLAFFINLCSSRALDAFKGDMAIMRSMGISVKVIRTAMYVRMMLSLIPAFVLLALTATLVFTSPALNSYFVYLYAWHYALILVGMLALVLRITHKQINRLFGESVRKALRGGAEE